MPPSRSLFRAALGRWRWPALALFLILAAGGLRLAYLICACPLDLAPDEAHYWDWSRHLDWSYYSKGPLVAYLIRLSGAWAGPALSTLSGSEMPAVRLPAILCGSLLLASLYVLARQVYGSPSLAALVVGLALTLPLLAAGSLLMTIDAPYTCCWGWALVAGHRAVFRGSWWAWPATGLLVGFGILAKYTMLLWLLSLGLFLLATPSRRQVLTQPGIWLTIATALLCCLPVLAWNAEHHWVSLRHVLGQAGLAGAPVAVRWLGPWQYVGVQFMLLLGFWFIAWVAAIMAHGPWKEQDDRLRYLWWMSVPTFGVFLLFSFKAPGEPNWPATAYLSGLVLTAGWLRRRLQSPARWQSRVTAVYLSCAALLGLGLTLLLHGSAWARPVLARLAPPAMPEQPLPLRRVDPTCRLRGWRYLAAEVDRVRTRIRSEGVEPVLAGTGWTLPGELAFYCAGHPAVFCLGSALGERHSQYDLWRPNPVADADEFMGRTVICVGEISPVLHKAFEQVETPQVVTYAEDGARVARWLVTVGRGFRGFRQARPVLNWVGGW